MAVFLSLAKDLVNRSTEMILSFTMKLLIGPQVICRYCPFAGLYKDKTLADKLIFMYIPNDDTPNYPKLLKGLISQITKG